MSKKLKRGKKRSNVQPCRLMTTILFYFFYYFHVTTTITIIIITQKYDHQEYRLEWSCKGTKLRCHTYSAGNKQPVGNALVIINTATLRNSATLRCIYTQLHSNHVTQLNSKITEKRLVTGIWFIWVKTRGVFFFRDLFHFVVFASEFFVGTRGHGSCWGEP